MAKGGKPKVQPGGNPGGLSPRMPRGLNDAAKAAWRGLVDDLKAAGLLNMVDVSLIELAAVQLGRAREARAILNAEGLTIVGSKGTVIKHPAAIIEAQASLEARRCLEVLGIGPTSRARLGAAGIRPRTIEDAVTASIPARGVSLVEG